MPLQQLQGLARGLVRHLDKSKCRFDPTLCKHELNIGLAQFDLVFDWGTADLRNLLRRSLEVRRGILKHCIPNRGYRHA
jgi:hypothetical protein